MCRSSSSDKNDEWFITNHFLFEFFHTTMLQTKKLTPQNSLSEEKSCRPPQNKTKQEEEDEEEGILPHHIPIIIIIIITKMTT